MLEKIKNWNFDMWLFVWTFAICISFVLTFCFQPNAVNGVLMGYWIAGTIFSKRSMDREKTFDKLIAITDGMIDAHQKHTDYLYEQIGLLEAQLQKKK